MIDRDQYVQALARALTGAMPMSGLANVVGQAAQPDPREAIAAAMANGAGLAPILANRGFMPQSSLPVGENRFNGRGYPSTVMGRKPSLVDRGYPSSMLNSSPIVRQTPMAHTHGFGQR